MRCSLTRKLPAPWPWILILGFFCAFAEEDTTVAIKPASPAADSTVAPDSSVHNEGKKLSFGKRLTGYIKEKWKIVQKDKGTLEDQIYYTEKIAKKLKAEHWKIRVILGEMQKLTNAISDLRDFQLYPANLMKADPKWAVKFDKRLEKREKSARNLQENIENQRRPLLDAIAIVTEMAEGDINPDMLKILEIENRMRVKNIILLKRELNIQWGEVEKLFNEITNHYDILIEKEIAGKGFDADFFAILNANLGRTSEFFYNKIKTVKDTLAERSTKKEWKQMASVDLIRLRNRISENQYEIAGSELGHLIHRYRDKIEISGLYYFYGQTLLAIGRYREARDAFDSIRTVSSYHSRAVFGKLKAYTFLEDYVNVMDHFTERLDTTVSNDEFNYAVFLAVQAAYRTEAEDSLLTFATKARKQYRYHADILYTLAQAYLRKGDIRTGINILNNVIQSPEETHGNPDIKTLAILTRSYVFFEQQNYTEAIKGFFKIMDEEKFFPEVLYGLVWSYIKTNQTQKADLTIKKLINQNPDHALAVEGFIVLAKKLIARAELEWEYNLFCDDEENKINNIRKIFSKRKKEKSLTEQEIKKAEKEIREMVKRHKDRTPVSALEIKTLYSMADEICNLIIRNYSSGYYVQATATGKRNKLVRELAELHQTITAYKRKMPVDEIRLMEENRKKSVQSVLASVSEAQALNIRILLKQQYWEKEMSDRHLTILNEKISSARNRTAFLEDSSERAITEAEIRKLTKSRNDFVTVNEEEKSERRNFIINKIESFLKSGVTGEQEQYFLYQLAELYYQEERSQYLLSAQKYETALSKIDSLQQLFDEGKIKEEPDVPETPRLTYEKSIEIYKGLVFRYPNGTFTDAAHYSLGYCYFDLGYDTLSHEQFQLLVQRFPESSYLPQAYMIIGEFYFDHADLEKAIEAYSKVVEFTESVWFDKALYKLGWSYYRLTKSKKAISSFLYLLTDNESTGEEKKDKKARSQLATESIDYIAISFAEEDPNWKGGGLEKATRFIKKVNDADKGVKIMHKLAEVYKSQGTDERLRLALKTYQAMLNMFPDYEKNPQVAMELIEVHEKQDNQAKANRLRIKLYRKYNRNAEWAKKRKDKNVVAFGDSIANQALYEAANNYILQAAQKGNVTVYKQALKSYSEYVKTYPTDKKTSECHYNKAEILFSLGDYGKASKEYMKVSRLYKDSKHVETAAWNAIVSAQNSKKQNAGEGPDLKSGQNNDEPID